MTPKFKIRTDLQRIGIDGFLLPLGIAPHPGRLKPPQQGYTVSFVTGEEDEPDTYSFHVVVSHDRLAGVLHRAFEFLPDEVAAIVEIGSRDAYRSTDTFISEEPIGRDEFLATWRNYEPFILEDSCIAAGANSEEPFLEIFVDQWKGLAIHVPPSMREEVESMLQEMGLEEVNQTWPERDEQFDSDSDTEENSQVRPVLDLSDPNAPDVDELLLDLRHSWRLALNIDPESNIDEGGRELGSTLWHAIVIVDRAPDSVQPKRNGDHEHAAQPGDNGGYASIWATAGSINQMEQLIEQALEKYPDWEMGEVFTIDRVAFDERPDELADLRPPPPGRREPTVHLITMEPWDELEKRNAQGDK